MRRWGRGLWVQLNEGQSMTEDELKAFCKDQITHFKIPRHVRFVTEYPMTVTGKIQKFVMRIRCWRHWLDRQAALLVAAGLPQVATVLQTSSPSKCFGRRQPQPQLLGLSALRRQSNQAARDAWSLNTGPPGYCRVT